jgi:membrane associated rhomboid family serine protease
MILIPFRTDRPRIRPAYLTLALIAANVLVHLYAMSLPAVAVPTAPGTTTEMEGGALFINSFGLWGSHPTVVALFAHQFIHADLLHLAGNMLFLWIFGSLIEDAARPWGLGALYLGGGILAALTHILISSALGQDLDVPMVGASGAVAAIMGLFMLRFYRTRVQVLYWFGGLWRGTFWVQSVWALLYWIVLELAGGVIDAAFTGGSGGVAHWAHIGGFAAGAIAAPLVGGLQAARQEYQTDDPETNVEHVRRGEQAEAAEKALRQDAGNPYLMRQMAQACRRAADRQRAIHTYQACITCFATRGMVEQAADVYLEALDYHGDPVLSPEVGCAVARQLEGAHPDRAAALYRLLVSRHVTRPEAEVALIRLSVLCRQRFDQPYEALRCLNEFLARYPNSPHARQARGARDALSAELRPG